jgi:hypothetical protein
MVAVSALARAGCRCLWAPRRKDLGPCPARSQAGQHRIRQSARGLLMKSVADPGRIGPLRSWRLPKTARPASPMAGRWWPLTMYRAHWCVRCGNASDGG